MATALTLSGSDPDGDTLSYVIVSAPSHGSLSGTGPVVTYTSAAGYVGVDSFSFAVSDGISQSPAVTAAITVTAAPTGARLLVAHDAARSQQRRALDGAVLTGGASAYIFVEPNGMQKIVRVSFLLDEAPFSVESSAPFDFAGTSLSRSCHACLPTAYPFESNLLALGKHRLTAVVHFGNGSQTTLNATFTIANTTSHSLLVSSSSTRSAPVPLTDATLSGRRYVFVGAASDPIAGLRTVRCS